MNKQEAIEELQNVAQRVFYRTGSRAVHIDKIEALVNQIDEPKKPVVPKFVADFYESIKDDFENKAYSLCLQYGSGNGELSSEFEEWFTWGKNEPIQTLVKMKLYGYEIEKEKLYTLEIPNPNIIGNERNVLMKNGFNQIVLVRALADTWRITKGYQLTESEIRKDFEWAFQFAKPVEE